MTWLDWKRQRKSKFLTHTIVHELVTIICRLGWIEISTTSKTRFYMRTESVVCSKMKENIWCLNKLVWYELVFYPLRRRRAKKSARHTFKVLPGRRAVAWSIYNTNMKKATSFFFFAASLFLCFSASLTFPSGFF